MKHLLDTHLLVWAASEPRRLSVDVQRIVTTQSDGLLFSVVSLWELAIKRALKRNDYDVDPRLLRRGLIDNGYTELPVLAEHVLAVTDLPAVSDPPRKRWTRTENAVSMHAQMNASNARPIFRAK